MGRTGRRPANEKRHGHLGALHLGGDIDHLIKAWGDEAGQADHVDLMGLGFFEDFLCGHHDAEVDDFIAITGEHDADNVLADIMHVAFDCRHQDFSV